MDLASALQQAKQQVAQMGGNIRDDFLDLPYKVAIAKDKFRRSFQPSIPFQWDNGLLGPTTPRIPKKEQLYQRQLSQGLLQPRQAAASAQPLPYMLPPESDLTRQQVEGYLEPFGLRPAAIDYFSQIPIKKGMGYVSGGSMGTSYKNPNFIGIGMNSDPSTLLHEYMHQAPRFLNPKGAVSTAFTKMFRPELTLAEPEFNRRWGKEYMSRPGAMQEEQFAERIYPEGYYKHIFK